MNRHRRLFNCLRTALVLAAASAFIPACVAAQASVQVMVNTAFVGRDCAPTAASLITPPLKFQCAITGSPAGGDISNEPHIEFDSSVDGGCANPVGRLDTRTENFCNKQVFLCTQIGVHGGESSTEVAIDEISFELFKFQDGSNSLDPGSTPPLRTFFIDSPGSAGGYYPCDAGKNPGETNCTVQGNPRRLRSKTIPHGDDGDPNAANLLNTAEDGDTALCVMWDGSYNIQGEFGKTNGQFGFRVKVKTNQVGASGNIQIEAVRAYPSGATRDASIPAQSVSQKPIIVDVTNVHVIRSSPTVIGQVTGVGAAPYNLSYRLSKDATTTIGIRKASDLSLVRTVVPGLQRIGEGTPQGTVLNGESWDGRNNTGDLLPADIYLADFSAAATDDFGDDSAETTTRQLAVDPLQITDIRVSPLSGGSTSLAVMSYMVTEPAKVYIDIYPPGTTFTAVKLNQASLASTDGAPANPADLPAKDFGASAAPLRSLVEVKAARSSVISFWDGRDNNGNLVSDGNYVFVIYASLPSAAGTVYRLVGADKRVWTSVAKVGLIPVLRGLVGITQVTPTSTSIGAAPAISGLNPFTFRYTLSREAVVSMKILNKEGTQVIKTLVDKQTRAGSFAHSETWVDGTNSTGGVVSPGTYMVELTAGDPLVPGKVSTTTAMFSLDLNRITDVQVSNLMSGATDNVVLSYQLSQPMFTAWNIYPAGTIVDNTAPWPPCPTQSPPAACTDAMVTLNGAAVAPIMTFRGMRPGRLKISEFWDGRDANGQFVPDGNYVFTLTAQSSTTPKYFATDRVYGNVTVARGSIVFTQFNVLPDTPQMFNSSNTITLHPYAINYALSRQSSVTVQILNSNIAPSVVRTIISGAVRPGNTLHTEVWDGRNDSGHFMSSGFYLVRAIAQDVDSILTQPATAQVTVAYDPLRIYDLAIKPLRLDSGDAALSYQVSETMKVSIKIYTPDTIFDGAGNPTPPEAQSLIKRIVGMRPARTLINENWNGTDFKFALVKDGSYKFKIVGSTDAAAIDDMTGNVLNVGALSLDRLIDDIPVLRNASTSPEKDFINNTFNYPNPVTGASTTFEIHSPFRGTVKMKIHTMSGDLVLDKNFGEVAPSYQGGPVTFVWNKTNAAGNKVARGLYFAVIRVEESEGGRNVLQTVKKVLIP